MIMRRNHSQAFADFQAAPEPHLKRLHETGQPEYLRVDDQRHLVVQDAEAYERLLDELDRLHTIQELRAALDRGERGESLTLDEAFARVRQQIK